TDDLKEFGVQLKDWKVDGTGTKITGRVMTKQELLGRGLFDFGGGTRIKVTAYDRDGAEIHGVDIRYPSLKPGEVGDFTIDLPGTFLSTDIERLFLDVK